MTGRALPQRDDDRTSLGLVPDVADEVHVCEGGWRLRDQPGGPLPCPVCKPHLVRRADPVTGRVGWRVDRSKLPAKGRRRGGKAGRA